MAVPNNHILYTYLTKAAVGVYGWNEISLRLPAAVLGAGCAPFGVLIARDWFESRRACFVGLLLAFMPFAIEMSQSARGYSGFMMCSMASMWFFTAAIEQSRKGKWIAYAAFTWAMIGFHLYGVFVFAVQAAWFAIDFIFNRSKGRNISIYISGALGMLLAIAMTFALYAGSIPQLVRYAVKQGILKGEKISLVFLWELIRDFSMPRRKKRMASLSFSFIDRYCLSMDVIVLCLLCDTHIQRERL